MSNRTEADCLPINVSESVSELGIITRLADLAPKTLLTEQALAGIFGVTDRTVRNMINRTELPPPISCAGRKMWFSGKILDWLESAAEVQEKEAHAIREKIRGYNEC